MKKIKVVILIMILLQTMIQPAYATNKKETLVIDYCDFSNTVNWKSYNVYDSDIKIENVRDDFGYSLVANVPYNNAPYVQYDNLTTPFTSGEVEIEADFMIDSISGRYNLFVVSQEYVNGTREANNDCYIQSGYLSGTGTMVTPDEWHHIKYVINIAEKYSKTYYDGAFIKQNDFVHSDGSFSGVSFGVINTDSYVSNGKDMKLYLDNIAIKKVTTRTQIVSTKYSSVDMSDLNDAPDKSLYRAEIEFDRGIDFESACKDNITILENGKEYEDFYVIRNPDNSQTVCIYFSQQLKNGAEYCVDLRGLKDEWGCKVMDTSVVSFDIKSEHYSGAKWSLWNRAGEKVNVARLKEEDEVRLSVEFDNVYEDITRPCVMAAAIYEGDRLTDVKMVRVSVTPKVPKVSVTTDYICLNKETKEDITIKGFLWESNNLSPVVENFMLFAGAKKAYKTLDVDFSKLAPFDDSIILNPSSYLPGFEDEKRYFDGTVCFAVDSNFIYGKDKRYIIEEKPIYLDRHIWVEKKIFENIFGTNQWTTEKTVNGKIYLPVVESASQLGYSASESFKGLVVVADKPYNISTQSNMVQIKGMLRYMLFERPTIARLKQIVTGKTHPRVLATEEDFDVLQNNLSPEMKVMSDTMVNDARLMLDAEVQTEIKNLPGGEGADYNAIFKLYWAYRMTGEKVFADKAIDHAIKMAGWSNWNSHRYFLQTAWSLMTCGYTYDLFQDELTDEQKQILREALVEKGLKPAIEHYYGRGQSDWPIRETNWNVVCNAGVIVGALAICNEYESELCFDAIEKAILSLEIALHQYAPEGGWFEGVGYSGFTTNFLTVALRSLVTAFGTEFGLGNLPGFTKNGYFPFYMTGYDGKFNLGDDVRGSNLVYVASSWMANYTKDKTMRDMRMEQIKYLNGNQMSFLDLLWYVKENEGEYIPAPLDKNYSYAEMATSRSSWDGSATWLAVHAGANDALHGQADIGQFEYEVGGVRFASDMGRDDYNLPDYFMFGSKRSDYYTCRAEGHNVYVINPDETQGQYYHAQALVNTVESKPDGVIYTIDMTPAYISQVKNAKRGFMLKDNRKIFVLQDEITPCNMTDEYYWFWHTEGSIEIIDNNNIVITKDNKKLNLYFDSNVEFTVLKGESVPLSTSPNPAGQLEMYGTMNKLTVRFASNKEKVTFRAVAVPVGVEYTNSEITEISDWSLSDNVGSSCYGVKNGKITDVKYGEAISDFLSKINSDGKAKSIIKDGAEVTSGVMADGMKLLCDGKVYDIEFVPIDDEVGKIYAGSSFDDYTSAVYATKATIQSAPSGFDGVYFGSVCNEEVAIIGEDGKLHFVATKDSPHNCYVQLQKFSFTTTEKPIVIEFDLRADNMNADIDIGGHFNKLPFDIMKFTKDGKIKAFDYNVGVWEANVDYHVKMSFTPGASNLFEMELNGDKIAKYHSKKLNFAPVTMVKAAVQTYSGKQASVWLDNFVMKRTY